MLDIGAGELLLRVGLALVLGGLVGVEREVHAQPAGFRTQALVALGACLFGMVSVHAFHAYVRVRADTNVQIDVTRVASQVVVGVGFLGGGAILKHGASVRGLTTAAALWVTAAIGLAVGLGFYLGAVATTVGALVALALLRYVRSFVRARMARETDTVSVKLAEGTNPAPVIDAIHGLAGVEVHEVEVRRDEETRQPLVTLRIKRAAHVDLQQVVGRLAERPGVEELWVGR